ncbi:MAG: DEAD/DEAH box helicase [Candidatus Krumholzibacteriota bacterium]|nr:DEAD/DEAH box helicase [Candidatus Krumholzibacteriota bacterium]
MAGRSSTPADFFEAFRSAGGILPDRSGLVACLRVGPVPASMLLDLARAAGVPGGNPIEEAASAPRRRETAPAGGEGGAPGSLPTLEEVFERLFRTLGERRPGQLEMAAATAGVLDEGGVLFVEAGTGTGKSLAYLVPAALHHLATGERIVVSTHTRNLQEQLLSREIPIVREAIGGNVRVERLMGRERYLCARHVLSAVLRLSDRPGEALDAAIAAALAPEGVVDELAGLPRGVDPASLAAPRRCTLSSCPHAAGCALIAARRRAREAAILLVNHALLFTDYRQGGGLLGAWDRVIFDEAHHIEGCVTDTLSVSAGSKDLDRILEPVSPLGRRNDAWKLLLNDLTVARRGEDWEARLAGAAPFAASLRERYRRLFTVLETEVRGAVRERRIRYRDGEETFAMVRDDLDGIYHDCNKLRDSFLPMLEPVVGGAAAVFQGEVGYAAAAVAELADALRYLAGPGGEEDVYWIERDGAGRIAAFRGSPIAVDRIFADFLEDGVRAAVFTSATLARNDRFDETMETLGVRFTRHEVRTLLPAPPFDPADNCLLLLHGDGRDPNAPEHADDTARVVAMLARRLGRRTMVLFTSYRMCLAAARLLAGEELPGPVLVQEPGCGREALAARLRLEPGATLLGVASFWEGVDFPGEELEVLVIPKLPFPVPSEPIVEARAERMRALGEDPFHRLFLPAAIRRLRQGMGRLIRRRDDRGVVVIMDPRIDARFYGRTILDALPVPAERPAGEEALVERAAAWFRR